MCDIHMFNTAGGGGYINERHTAKMLILLRQSLVGKTFRKRSVALTQLARIVVLSIFFINCTLTTQSKEMLT